MRNCHFVMDQHFSIVFRKSWHFRIRQLFPRRTRHSQPSRTLAVTHGHGVHWEGQRPSAKWQRATFDLRGGGEKWREMESRFSSQFQLGHITSSLGMTSPTTLILADPRFRVFSCPNYGTSNFPPLCSSPFSPPRLSAPFCVLERSLSSFIAWGGRRTEVLFFSRIKMRNAR